MIDEIEEDIDVGSFNHAMVQANLTWLLKNLGKYTVCTELSLEVSSSNAISGEVKPDVCIYPKRHFSLPLDIIKMTEMRLLAIEVLSLKQGIKTILEKFKLYFELGVKSCWLILPNLNPVIVYPTINRHKNFSEEMVIDEVLDIRLPMTDIFS